MLRAALRLVAVVFIASGTIGLTAAHATECRPVRGNLEETPVAGGCTSPVGVCTVAQMFGTIRGEAQFYVGERF